MFRSLAFVALIASPALAAASTPAFPGAEGAGALARGGRGGAVLKVTNLNDAGPGSLRAAVEAKGPRTVIFEVSGTIALKRPLKITEPLITIAGQTAPGDGVTLRGHPLEIAADDVVVRYLRSRLGDETGVQNDAVSVNSGRRIILDHLSASWSVDETLSVSANYSAPGGGPYDVTVQWCLIGESLNRSLHDKGAHGYGSLVRGGRGSQFSFHHNLWASHTARMPRPGNYTEAKDDPLGAFFDFRNNVFYNWGGDASGYNADNGSLAAYNFVGNAYIPGPNTGKKPAAFKESNPVARGYFEANAMNGVVPTDPWSLVIGLKEPANRLAQPVNIPHGATQSWDAAMAAVLDKAGASKQRDPVDQRIVAGVRSRTHAIINSETEVGGWPVLKSAPAPADKDGDGMSDAWERSHGLDPANPADGKTDRDGDGFTNLEDYLNSLVG
jgi:hypothetical protein